MLLGIDIGGTTISLGLVDDFNIVKKICVPSFDKKASMNETIDYLISRIEEIITPEVESIGVGVPTLVDSVCGVVFDAANIPSWTEVPLKAILEERFGVRVIVNNDANCYVLGAASRLEKKYPVVVGVTLGTGIGVGVVNDGKLFCGTNCGVGEIGAIPYMGKDYESFCSSKFFADKGTTGGDAAKAVAAGDKEALALFEEFGRHLGTFLSVVMFAYDPGCIIIGGGLSRSYDLFADSMMEALRAAYPYSRSLDRLKIIPMHQDENALLGASLM